MDAIALSLPDLIACDPGENLSGQFNPYSPRLPNFINQLVTWVSNAFPKAAGIHVGGDEVNPGCWWDHFVVGSSGQWWGTSYSFFKALDRYYAWIHNAVFARKRKFVVAWEESVLGSLGLSNYIGKTKGVFDKGRTIVQSWRDLTSLRRALNARWMSLFSIEGWWYLDCGHYCTPLAGSKSLPTVYKAPLPSNSFLLGGEVVVFTEETHAGVLDAVIWPRAAAAAERLWSSPAQSLWDKLCTSGRVDAVSRWLSAVGVVPWDTDTVMV